MRPQRILDCCLAKPGAYLDFPFGPDVLIVKVKASRGAGRIFAQVFTLRGEPCATFNCDMLTGELYRAAYPGVVSRGYHCPPVQQPYFNTVRLAGDVPDAGGVPDEVLLQMIDHSYATVVAKLPKYAQKELAEQSE
ncbi:MAG: MmcQ/YjbR family DNA-binding protein [Clostridia bacterium]|nr:MmcQ/YjbR family DNA-binding protein [Clostridia bacterium]